MILQALNRYYERMNDTFPGELSEFGFERKNIPVILELKASGGLHQIAIDKDKNSSKTYVLPKAVKKAAGIAANLFWDNAEYVLGLCRPNGKPDRVEIQHSAFVKRINKLEIDDPGLKALKSFLNEFDLEELKARSDFDDDFFSTNPNISFKLAHEPYLICETKSLREQLKINADTSSEVGLCLVTGSEKSPTARLHPAIKGVWGAQSAGANIVSFNLSAFSSFNKKQGNNAPISELAAFNYTEALNYLLRKNSPQRTQLGDSSTVFWSEEGHKEIENAFRDLISMPEKLDKKDDPNKNTRKLKGALQAFRRGRSINTRDDQRFYILGLAPNASRIAIRFWNVSTIKEVSTNICQHYEDTLITRPKHENAEIPVSKAVVTSLF